jgi:hypothetical protein
MSLREAAYRDETPGLQARIAELRPRREAERAALVSLERLAMRRSARSLGGVVAALGVGALMPLGALFLYGFRSPPVRYGEDPITLILLAAGGLALLTFGVLRLVDKLGVGRAARAALPLTGEPHHDLHQLQQPTAGTALLDAVERQESWSVGLPLVGLALAMPLTLHFLFYLLVAQRTAGFDAWIGMSAVVVGHAHVVLVAMAIRFARRLKRTEDVLSLSGQGWWAFLWTVVASAIPGIILYAIPVVLVAITGIVFIPLSFRIMARRVAAERELIASCRAALTPAA